jgi:FG-GAP repeat
MPFGHHVARPKDVRRRQGFRPSGERLEARELLAIDLANIAGGSSTTQPGPYGVLEAGINNGGGSGFSVAEVGDVNGDGFDDFVIGEPTVVRNGTGVALGNGSGSKAYLVFGSDQVTAQTVDYLTLTSQQRVGSLSGLGNALQNNPTNGAPGFAFDGLTFTASQNPNAALGASVAAVGDVNGDGFADFMIGAPGANDSVNALNAAGRAYLVYGGPNLNRTSKSVDLDNPTANSDLNILTFVNNVPNGAVGRSVASAGDILPDGLLDIAIGAPNATLNGLPNSGGVYVISGTALRPARTQTIPLQSVGQGGAANVPGVVFAGSSPSQNAGFSVAAGGNFAGTSINGIPQNTLLIGAPQFNVGPGQVSVIYSAPGLSSAGITTNGFSSILLNRVAATVNGISGATITGDNTGDQTGYSVSTAGDFNGDNINDILIGSPGFNNAAGRVNMIFGRPALPALPGPIVGNFTIATLGASISQAEFDGVSSGALAGYSISSVGRINADSINEILIGSPGANNSSGLVYLIPGNADLVGVFNLGSTETTPIQGLIISSSLPAAGNNYLGTSVSGRLGLSGAGKTVDSDGVSDFVLGAPGFGLNTSIGAGGTYLLEGAFVPLPNVVSTAITSPIGVAKPLPPFAINATSPADLTIYILSKGSNTPGFDPFRDIDPTTLTVNGVAVPDPTTFKQETDLDGDGIPDASFVFSPRSLLNLPNGVVTFTVAGRTLSTSIFPNRRYTGVANVSVSGGSSGGGGGGGGLPSDRTTAFANLGAGNMSNLPFGERLVPTNAILSTFHYKPLRPFIAHRQFLPTNGFSFRNHAFFHPSSKNVLPPNINGLYGDKLGGVNPNVKAHRPTHIRAFPKGTFTGHIKIQGPHIP